VLDTASATPAGAIREPAALELTGTLDRRSAERTRPILFAAIDRTTAGLDVVVDLGQVTHVDSCGLGMLLAGHRRAAAGGCRLVLRSPGPGLVRAVAVTKLNRVLCLSR
jgi:anti-sigma B factor antagonist